MAALLHMTVDDPCFKLCEVQYERDMDWDLEKPQEAIYANAGLFRYSFAVSSGVNKHTEQEVKSEMLQSFVEKGGVGSMEDGALALADAPKAYCHEYKDLGAVRTKLDKHIGVISKLRNECSKMHAICVAKNNSERVCLR